MMAQPRSSLLQIEKLKSQGVTWQRSQGGAALDSNPLDIIDNYFVSVLAYLLTNVRADEDISENVIQKVFMFRKLREVSVFFEKYHATICVGGCLFLETSFLVLHFLW